MAYIESHLLITYMLTVANFIKLSDVQLGICILPVLWQQFRKVIFAPDAQNERCMKARKDEFAFEKLSGHTDWNELFFTFCRWPNTNVHILARMYKLLWMLMAIKHEGVALFLIPMRV